MASCFELSYHLFAQLYTSFHIDAFDTTQLLIIFFQDSLLSCIIGKYIVFHSENIDIISCSFIGWYFVCAKLLQAFFFHIQSYLYCFILLIRRAEEKGSLQNNTIAPFGFIILFSSAHIGSKGITESHLQAVVPYGGSVIIASILPSGIDFIISMQSQRYAVQFFIFIKIRVKIYEPSISVFWYVAKELIVQGLTLDNMILEMLA